MLDPQVAVAYPKAARAVYIVEEMTSSNFFAFSEIVGEVTGDTMIEAFQVMADKEGVQQVVDHLYYFSQKVGIERTICDQFLTEDFKRYLAAKLGMM